MIAKTCYEQWYNSTLQPGRVVVVITIKGENREFYQSGDTFEEAKAMAWAEYHGELQWRKANPTPARGLEPHHYRHERHIEKWEETEGNYER